MIFNLLRCFDLIPRIIFEQKTELQNDFDRHGFAVARGLLSAEEVSRIRDTFMELAKDGPVPVDLKAGDVLFFNGSVIHGSYPNTSKTRFRRSLIFHYVPLTSQELSQWYREPMTFDGRVVEIAAATGGGPCGTLNDVGAVH
jgi:hypothetical protein